MNSENKNANYMKIIKFNSKHFDNNYQKSKIFIKEFKKLENWIWKNENNQKVSDKTFDKEYKKLKKMEEKKMLFFSMYSLITKIDKYCHRKKEEQIDVTKIYVNDNTYNLMKEHDKLILKLFENFNKKRIEKEISWLFLFSGFSIDNNLKDFNIGIQNNHLKNRTDISN